MLIKMQILSQWDLTFRPYLAIFQSFLLFHIVRNCRRHRSVPDTRRRVLAHVLKHQLAVDIGIVATPVLVCPLDVDLGTGIVEHRPNIVPGTKERQKHTTQGTEHFAS